MKGRMLEWLRETMGISRAFDRLMVAAAFAAFLALWLPAAPHLSHRAALLGVGLMGVALIVFVAWQVVHVMVVQAGDRLRLKIIRQNLAPDEFLPAFARAEESAQRAGARMMLAWPIVFAISTIPGLAAALLVSYDAFAPLAGWPAWPADPPGAHDTASPALDVAPNDR